MNRFRLIDYDEGGPKTGKEGDIRLVCNTEEGDRVAIWGSDHERYNIDAVLKAGLPCTIVCDTIQPADWSTKYNHTHWVPEANRLLIET